MYHLVAMKFSPLILIGILFISMNIKTRAQTPKDLAEFWDKQHISTIFPSNARHKDLKNYLEQLKKLEIKVEAQIRLARRAIAEGQKGLGVVIR